MDNETGKAVGSPLPVGSGTKEVDVARRAVGTFRSNSLWRTNEERAIARTAVTGFWEASPQPSKEGEGPEGVKENEKETSESRKEEKEEVESIKEK